MVQLWQLGPQQGLCASKVTCPCSVLVEGRVLNLLDIGSNYTGLANQWFRIEMATWEWGRVDSLAEVLSIPKIRPCDGEGEVKDTGTEKGTSGPKKYFHHHNFDLG